MTIYSIDVLLAQFGVSPSSRPVPTVASWPAHRFLRRQVRWSVIPISFRIFQFVVIHTVEGFRLINEVEVDVFLEFSCFFNDPVDVGNLIYGFSAFSKSSLNTLKFSVQVLLKPSLETFFFFFFSITLLSCEMSAIVQYFEHSLA